MRVVDEIHNQIAFDNRMAGGDMDEGAFGFLYLGALSLGFLGFLALGMSRLVRWIEPKGD